MSCDGDASCQHSRQRGRLDRSAVRSCEHVEVDDDRAGHDAIDLDLQEKHSPQSISITVVRAQWCSVMLLRTVTPPGTRTRIAWYLARSLVTPRCVAMSVLKPVSNAVLAVVPAVTRNSKLAFAPARTKHHGWHVDEARGTPLATECHIVQLELFNP